MSRGNQGLFLHDAIAFQEGGIVEQLMTTEEVAEAVRVPVSTIYYWRAQGIGPVGSRVGKRVLYRQDDVEKWLEERRLAEQPAATA